MSDYSELKRLIEEAFGWEWSSDGSNIFAFAGEDEHIAHCYAGYGNASATAEYIAAVSQSVVLAIINQIEVQQTRIIELAQAANAARDEAEALRKDAERYQWLRDSSESIHQFYLSTPIWFTGVKFSKENVDSTIDAAMSKETPSV